MPDFGEGTDRQQARELTVEMSESGYAIQPNQASAVAGEVALPRSGAETQPFASRLLWLVSFPAMLGVFLVARVFASMRSFYVDGDLWYHITTGQIILTTHHWPTTEPYTFTVAGQPWIACEWMGDVLLAAVSRPGGVLGLDILLIVLGSAVMVALYYLGTLRSGNSKAGFLAAGLLSSLAFASFTLRPQMLGYLFLALTMIALEFFRQGKHRVIWFLPPLMLLWVNTHGSFIIGIGAIFVYWISGFKPFERGGIAAKAWTPSERRQISFVFMLCLAVLPLTPYGTQVAMYPFNVAFKLPVGVANVMEWAPMPFNDWGGKLFLGILLGFLLLQVIYQFSWRLEEFALFLFGTMMAILHMRFVLIFVPFCAPLLATIFARWLPSYDRRKEHYALNAILIAGVVALMVWFHPTHESVQGRVDAEFPVSAVNFIQRHHVPGPMFNEYYYGGYLIWSGEKVFMDGRADPEERGGALDDYLHVADVEPGALRVLSNYRIQSCLIKPGSALATLLSSQPDWQRVYWDNNSIIFVRRNASAASNLISVGRK